MYIEWKQHRYHW